jgi:hypothetical protein
MRNSLFILIIAIVTAFSGACGMLSKDAEINSFVVELDKLSAEIVRTVDEKPTAQGVDQAQQLLDARKTELKASFEKLKDARGFQVSEEAKKKFTDAITKDVSEVNSLQIKHAGKTVTDKSFGEKLSNLSADFNSILGV